MPIMPNDAILEAWRDAAAALRDLPIDTGDPAEIINNLRIIARQIALIETVALDDFVEPAPIFRA